MSMKLNDKKFGKIIAEPNLLKSAEPRTEPKFRSLPSHERANDCHVSRHNSLVELFKCKNKTAFAGG